MFMLRCAHFHGSLNLKQVILAVFRSLMCNINRITGVVPCTQFTKNDIGDIVTQGCSRSVDQLMLKCTIIVSTSLIKLGMLYFPANSKMF